AIVELGNQTFGATGTNTIILFLRKKETFKQENHLISQDYSLIKERIEAENLKDNESFYQNYLNTYCDFRKFDKELYSNFLNGNLDSKLAELEAFKDYRNAFRQTSDYKKLKESKIYKESKDKQDLEDKAFLAYAQAIEKDKLLYFSLSLNQEVLIIKSPSDIKEQKKFLGYEWSNRKGDEGLKELHEPYLSPLFERGNPQNETKLNTLICKAFLKTLSDIPKDLQGYASKARLVDMMDFEKVEFNKAISLNPKTQREEIKSQYPLVKLKICGDFFMGGTPSRKNINYWNGDIKWLTISDYSNRQVIMDTKEKITREGFKNSNAKMIQKGAVVVSIYATIGRVGILGEDMTTNQAIVAIIPNEEFINKYLMYAIDYFKFQLYNEVITTSQQNINLGILQNMVIPKPPLEIQKQIVAECEKVEEQYNTIRMSVEEYQNLIKAILQKCGIIDDGGGV
ncbi:restriction endonuclease, partial [Campylobacter coli]|nr:restriction endonuclease [Campylobacter coli]